MPGFAVSPERIAAAAEQGWQWSRYLLGHIPEPPPPHRVANLHSEIWVVLQPGPPRTYDCKANATWSADRAQGHHWVERVVVGFPSMAEAGAFMGTAEIAIDTSRHVNGQ